MLDLVFLPGASGSTLFWLPLIERLADNISSQIIAYPGFAQEPYSLKVQSFEQLSDYVLAQIDRPCILVAQSMGGIFAVQAALKKPELIQGMVLIATSGGIDLTPFKVADWRQAYSETYIDYPDWFIGADVKYDQQIGSIGQKVLLIWGDQDFISPVRVGQYLLQKFQHATLYVVAGAEHDLAHAYAEQVADKIKLYLARLSDT